MPKVFFLWRFSYFAHLASTHQQATGRRTATQLELVFFCLLKMIQIVRWHRHCGPPSTKNTDASTFSTSIAVSHKYRSKSFQELFRASKATTPVEGVEHVFVDVSSPNLLSAIYP